MTYQRVVPRDLFNEASLLKCLGRLYIVLENHRDHSARLDEIDGESFQIEQSDADGSISVVNLPVTINGELVRPYRPLNSREPWPLWVDVGDDAIRVFDEHGEISDDFWEAIGDQRKESVNAV